MMTQVDSTETIQHRVLLVLPDSHKVLVIETADGCRIPRVRVAEGRRIAESLQQAIRAIWRMQALVLDYLPPHEEVPSTIVAEVLSASDTTFLKAVDLSLLPMSELPCEHRERIVSLWSELPMMQNRFSRVGWIDDAISWVEEETGGKLTSKEEIRQYNAGGSFALVRFPLTEGRSCWLKATGAPNAHEFSLTSYLSRVGADYLPPLISTKVTWNAWLMSGEASGLPEMSAGSAVPFALAEDAVRSMAALQRKTAGKRVELLHAGAFDQGAGVFQAHSEALFDYLEEAMSLQLSTRAPRLEQRRLRALRMVLDEVCDRMEQIGLPETVVHGDMNRGNILVGPRHCQFIDWCEAYVGNPLITLQHLLLLDPVDDTEACISRNRVLQGKYRDAWATEHDATLLDRAFPYMPLLAIASTLYGRGDWLTSPQRNDPFRQAYARTLARCMDRASREPGLAVALAHRSLSFGSGLRREVHLAVS